MKKYLVFIIVALLSVSNDVPEVEACCPDPSYTQYTVSTFYPGTTCEMDIVFCYKQQFSGDRSFVICQVNFDATSCFGVNVEFDSQFWEFVDLEVIKKMDALFPFDPCPFSGGQTNLISEITKANCMEVIDDFELEMSILVSCGTGSADCVTYYEVCRDNGELIISLESGPYKQGFDVCPLPGEDPFTIGTDGCFSICY